MSFSIQIEGIDVSNFVNDVSSIPFITRNEDYMLVTDEIDLELTQTYSRQFGKQDSILIYSGSTLLFNGVITSTQRNDNNKTFEYIAESKLELLRNYMFDYNTMFGYLDAYTEHINVCLNPTSGANSWKTSFISYNNLIQAMFDCAGITLDWSELQVEYIENIQVQIPYVSAGAGLEYLFYQPTQTSVPGQYFKITDAYFYVYQLFCMNQNNVYCPDEIEAEEDRIKDKLSLYEALAELISIGGYVFIPKDTNTYYIINRHTDPIRSANYEEYALFEDRKPKNTGIELTYKRPYQWGDGYIENLRYSVLPFMQFPGTPFEPITLYYAPAVGTRYFNLKLIKDFTTTKGTNRESVKWINHLIPYWMIWDATYSTYLPYIVFPHVRNEQSLIRNKVKASVGHVLANTYENLVNTERRTVVENYITIKEFSDRKPYSAIKTMYVTSVP